MKTVLTLFGMLLIAVSLYEQFQTLFHPSGHGTLTDWISQGVWRIFRPIARHRPGILSLAGPFALVTIILVWAGLLVLGCTFIYYPRLTSFVASQEITGQWPRTYFSSFTIAMASLMTMSADVRPTVPWIRLLMIVEGGLGLALVTACVSWLLSIYPVLENRSSIAEQGMSLFEAERETGLDVFTMADVELAAVLLRFGEELSALHNQTVQFPITYFFGVRKRRSALEVILPYIDGLAERACETRRPPTLRIAGHGLQRAVESYVRLLGHRYLGMAGENKDMLLRAYAEDHLRESLPKRPCSPGARARAV
jgi:hypothetical protein